MPFRLPARRPARALLLAALLLPAGPSGAAPADPVAPARCAAAPGGVTAPPFGCANHLNLVRMADPAHLVAGAAPPPGPAILDIEAVGRLLQDRVRDLRREGAGGSGAIGSGRP